MEIYFSQFWRLEYQMPASMVSSSEKLLQFGDCLFLATSTHGRDQKERASSLRSLIRAPIPFMKASSSPPHLILITS